MQNKEIEEYKQKLIEKLEKDIENSEKGLDTNIILIKEYYRNKKEYAEEILEIVKGDKQWKKNKRKKESIW